MVIFFIYYNKLWPTFVAPPLLVCSFFPFVRLQFLFLLGDVDAAARHTLQSPSLPPKRRCCCTCFVVFLCFTSLSSSFSFSTALLMFLIRISNKINSLLWLLLLLRHFTQQIQILYLYLFLSFFVCKILVPLFVVVVLCLHLKKILQKNNGGRGGWGTQTICNNIYVLCFAYTHTRAYTFSHAHELTKTNGSRDANVDAHDINDATTTTTQRPWTCPNASMNRTELNACPTPTTTTTVGCCCVALPECCLCCCCC